MDQEYPKKVPDTLSSEASSDILKMLEEGVIHDFCPRLASTPQSDALLPTSSSPVYSYCLLNAGCSSPGPNNTSINPIPVPRYTHGDLLDVIEASELASAPLSMNTYTFPPGQASAASSVTMTSAFSSAPHNNKPLYSNERIGNSNLSRPVHPATSSYSHTCQVYSDKINILPLSSASIGDVHSPHTLPHTFRANVRYVRPSNVCTEGFVVPNGPRTAGAFGAKRKHQSGHQPHSMDSTRSDTSDQSFIKIQTPPSSVRAEASIYSVVSDLKYHHRDSKLGCKKSSPPESQIPVRLTDPIQWNKRSPHRPVIFDFSSHGGDTSCGNDSGSGKKRKPLSEMQVNERPNFSPEQNVSLCTNLHQLQMLSLRDLGRTNCDSSGDSGLDSQRTTSSRELEGSKSREEFFSSSGEFTPDSSNQKDSLLVIPREKRNGISQRSTDDDDEPLHRSQLKFSYGPTQKGTQRTGAETGADESPEISPDRLQSPGDGGGKLLRKPVTPIRSASPVDPKFRGVTLQMRTKLQQDDHVQLSIKAFFNCRKAQRAPMKKSPVREQPLELRRMRQDSTSSTDSECGVEIFPEKKRRTHSSSGKQCASCGTKTTPLWRDAEDGTPLCNACGIRYKKYRVRCTRCWHIPRKETKANIQCNNCGEPLRISLFRSKQWKC